MTMKKWLYILFALLILGLVSFSAIVLYYTRQLPDHNNLKKYDPPLTTRLYSADGKFLKEYAKEKRIFIPIQQIPDIIKQAFISAEDSTFYTNSGISFKGILSAGWESVTATVTGKGRIRGASTITQQVAKNFLLTNERTITRKIKEVIIAIRLTHAFKKDEILELYLNQIFFGNRSYGIGAAALNYFNKPVDEITIEEAALLAALPKAPSTLDPTRSDGSDVIERRNWIIGRMELLGYISPAQATKARETPINLQEKEIEFVANGEFFSEEVRKQIVKLYGENGLLEKGNVVSTTIDPDLQVLADKYLKEGIEAYDLRHGFRGAIGNIAGEIDFENNWGDLINKFKIDTKFRSNWEKAVVLDVDRENEILLIGLKKVDFTKDYNLENNAFVRIANDDKLLIMGYIPLENAKWAREFIDVDTVGEEPKTIRDLKLKVGDVIIVERSSGENEYYLRQIPAINGALLAMDLNNGRILAMMGGYIDSQLDFNRVTQAERQPGSTMKPFAYLTALENGFTPANMIIDEEIELYQGDGRPPYRPKNTEGDGIFFGPTTLRVGLEKSRNVTTIRMASEVGMKKIAEVVRRFGINKRPQPIYSLVLGSTETNLLKMVRAYSMIANGGKIINPVLIEKIQDKNGNTIFKRDGRECRTCSVSYDTPFDEILVPEIVDNRKNITDSATAYQLTNMLVGAVQRGTGYRAKAVGKPIGGKTGTTNDGKDAWFIGFSPDIAVGVYIGFDKPEVMGKNEYGSNVAGPIFTNFMTDALKDRPSAPFRVPQTVKLMRIDTKTGYYPTQNSKPNDIVMEAFKLNEEPQRFQEEATERIIDELDMDWSELDNQPEIIMNVTSKHQENEDEAAKIDEGNYDIEFSGEEVIIDSDAVVNNKGQKKKNKIYKMN